MALSLRKVAKRLHRAKRAVPQTNDVFVASPEPAVAAKEFELVENAVAPVGLSKAEDAALPQPKLAIEETGTEKAIRIRLPEAYKTVAIESDYLSKIKDVHEIYPLVTTIWQGTKYVVATATIKFNPLTNQLVYFVEEPLITDDMRELISKTLQLLQERLEIDPAKLKARKATYLYIDEKINEIWDYLGARLSEDDELKAKYYVLRDTIGFGKLEPLMRDPNIEDLSCDGHGVPVFIFHRNPLYGGVPTNILFKGKEELDSYVMKLAQKAGRTISIANPLLDATLPDGSRLQATFGTDIAKRGSNFSIRKFFYRPLTIVDLMNYGTTDPLLLAYLWLAEEAQQSILVAGTTAVGKTTFLNSIAQFIKPNSKIVSIEDTSELKLTNINWVPQIARAGYGPKKYGEVTMFDLLKAALRQRPDVLIVGEVRGREAAVMFQAMATGHSTLSTLHADSIEAVIDRLTTRPISLPTSLLQNLDIIVFLEKAERNGRLVRRVDKIIEVEGYDRKADELKTNCAFEWLAAKDIFVSHDSVLLAKIARRLGWSGEEINEELMRRANILKWLQARKVTKLRDLASIISLYYTDPDKLRRMMAGT